MNNPENIYYTWTTVEYRLILDRQISLPYVAKRRCIIVLLVKKEQIVVLGCINAIGQAIPPNVIFEGKYLNHQ